MHWRACFFFQEKHESDIWRKNFGFKLKSTLPQFKHMEVLEREFLNMIPNIKFRSVKDTFHKMLKEDIPKIKKSPNVSVTDKTDKTSDIYEMLEQQHKKLLHDNIKKTYQKVPPKLEAKLGSKKHCQAH